MPDEGVEEQPCLLFPCADCGENEQSCNECNRCDDCGCECIHCPHCGDRAESTCERCERCNDCCECHTCNYGRHSHVVEFVCGTCELCPDHCECSTCDNCSDRVENVCGDCDRCDDCGCNCSSDSDAPRVEGRFTYIGKTTKDMPRYTSLELEYAACDEAYTITQACERWKDYCVDDGSLPNEGFEINTNPSRGDEYFSHIADICDSVRKADTKVTSVCGLHVHVDARDLNWHDLYKLGLLYMRVEDALFKMQPRSRQDNRYCLRVENKYRLDPKGYKHKLLRTLYEHSFPEHKKQGRLADVVVRRQGVTHSKSKRVFSERTDKYNSARYYAMNLHTFFYRGTIEFRHAASTTNTEKATNWGLVCMHIVDQAAKMSVAQINALHANSTKALLSILPANLTAFVIARQEEQASRY